jgi:hypothetical protein
LPPRSLDGLQAVEPDPAAWLARVEHVGHPVHLTEAAFYLVALGGQRALLPLDGEEALDGSEMLGAEHVGKLGGCVRARVTWRSGHRWFPFQFGCKAPALRGDRGRPQHNST